MGEFVDDTEWRRTAGAPRIAVSAELQEILDETHRTKRFYQMPAADTNEDRADFVRLLKAHARHRGLSVTVQEYQKDGEDWIQFRMREKRAYTKSPLPREKR